MERAHWILRAQHVARCVMDQISDERFYDGLILGVAIAAVPFIAWLWWTGN